ncbi:toprim domain-containing protein [Comamonas sp. SY3]|uniref:toprim domain-containing protein n=1 Tax=Comamonas sp. SY3 TaxID=3243601 RepID=UPI003594199D
MSGFITFARAHGVEINPAKFHACEKIRRCGTTDKPKSTAGAYFWDGERGWVFNWSGEAKVQWWNDANARPWTEQEKAEWKARRQAAKATQEQDYHRAAMRSQEMLRAAKPMAHNYLHRKGFPDAQGFVSAEGALLIPMRNLQTNAVQGVQVIRWDELDRKFEKKMAPGMKAKGAVFRMGDKTAPEVILCEGYATGLSIVAALRSVGLRASVLVCFSAVNLEFIAQQVKGRVYVFADNDASQTGERAAIKSGFPYCMSTVVGEDANDLHQRAGLFAVAQKLMEVRRK